MRHRKATTSSIKAFLPRGWRKRLSSENSVSEQTVSQVVNQKLVSHWLWPKVLLIVQEEKQKINKLITETDDLIGKEPVSVAKRVAMNQKLA